MDQERFDELAKKVFDSSSRRRVLGGALASALGAGVAAVSGIAAKGNKGKGRSKKGKGKKAGAEFVCTADNANDVCDNDSCCASTPAGNGPICVTFGTQASGTQQFCGNLNDGSGVCRRCPAGTVCSLDADNELRCICTPGSCANGCCINNDNDDLDDECITPNGFGQAVNSVNPDFDGAFVCGTGGSECNVCSDGTIFSGCCTATGACTAGESAAECGSNGEVCEDCRLLGPNATCSSQTCVGGTTTTTAGPTTTTTTTAATCPAGKTACPTATGLLCCGKKKRCRNSGTADAKCKKKK
jgi:hypothetical protein